MNQTGGRVREGKSGENCRMKGESLPNREGSKRPSWQREAWHQYSETWEGLASWRNRAKLSGTGTVSEV